MGDPLMDFDELLKYIVPLVLVGGWMLRSVYRSLVKAARQPRQPGAPPSGPPAKGLREFLEEIRQEEGGEKPAADAAPAGQAEEFQWEEVDVGQEEAPPPRPDPAEERLAERRRQTELRRQERAQRRQERAQRRQERQRQHEFQPPEEQRLPEEVTAAEPTSLADRHLDSELDEREIGSQLDDRHLESGLSDRRIGRLAGRGSVGRKKAGTARAKTLAGALQGLTVRDLVLAQVILGKPRSKKRHFREV